MSSIWVVVADASRARIFSAEKPNSALEEVQTLTHPASRLHEGDLVAERQGRERNPGGGGHEGGHEQEAKEEEANRFAIEVNDVLEAARNANRFYKLYVVAAPSFLGLLRKQQSAPLKRLLAEEVSKNLSTLSPADIRKSLPEYL
jgi:protein required for attachment to host cells